MNVVDRLDVLRTEATPGPWEILHGWSTEKYAANVTQADDAEPREGHDLSNVAHSLRVDDAALIVAAVNALPALLRIARAAAAWDAHVKAGEKPAGSLAAMQRWMDEQEPLADELRSALSDLEAKGA